MGSANGLTIAIVAACPFPWPRGTPIRTFRIAESLAQRGHTVHVITYHLGEESNAPFEVHRIDDMPGYQKTSAGPSIRKMTHLNPALIKLLKSLSTRIQFDVIHAIHFEGLLVAHKALPNLPIVYDAHTSLSGELPDYIQYVPRRLISYIGAFFDRTIPVKADLTIAVSDSLKDMLINCQAVKTDAIDVIPNGVEFDLFQSPEELTVDPEQIIFTGNDSKYQRLDLLLSAFLILIETRPQAKLTVVGSSGFEQEREFVKTHGLTNSVQILTRKFDEELKHLAVASIAVSPRTLCDGVPQKILNYMAAGKVVVACEGSAVHLKDGVTGVRVPNDDPQAMASALNELMEDFQYARQLGQAAQLEMRDERSWQSVAQKIEDVYLRAIRNKKSLH